MNAVLSRGSSGSRGFSFGLPLARVAVAVAVAVASAACLAAACSTHGSSGSSFDGGTADPFVGTWVCTGTDDLTITTPTGIPPVTESTAATIVIADDGSSTISATRSTEGGAGCVTQSIVAGSNATLESGQTCTSGGLTLTLVSGGANVMNGTLVSSRRYTLSGTLTYTPEAGMPQSIQVTGTGSSTDNCAKQ
jgi:hypothetical protein